MSFFSPSGQDNPYLQDPDVVLMLKFQEGDKASFEKLIDKYYKRIFNLIYRFVNDRDTAEDLTQEVFIKIYKSQFAYRPRAKFNTWLYQIAKNISLNELRRLKKQTVSLDEPVKGRDHEFKRDLIDSAASNPYQNASDEEKRQIIRGAIQALPENQRLAVILRRYEKLSYEDIALSLNCSVKAVKSLLSRAKENLKERLSGLIDS